MFKTFLKLTIVTLAFVGGGMLFAGSHAAADQSCAWAPATNWGVSVGPGSGAMAGAIVHSTRDSASGPELDTQYTLDAYSPDGSNNKIFRYPAGAQGSTNEQLFGTGSILTAGSQIEQCKGWDVLGPGQYVPDPAYPSPGHTNPTAPQWGNGWVLDCGTENGNASKLTQFWISRIPNPSGENGHWEVQVFGVNGTQLFDDQDYFANTPGFTVGNFSVVNGANIRINLIWHQSTWHLNGTTTVSDTSPVPGERVTWRHSVTNNGPSPASYSWWVIRDGSRTGTSGAASNVSSGAVNPNQATDSFQIPFNASDKAQYCEHVEFSNSSGPGTGTGSSSAVCVTVHQGPTHTQIDGACTQLDVQISGNYDGHNKRAHVQISPINLNYVNIDNGGKQDVSSQNIHSVDENIPGNDGSTDSHEKKYFYQPADNAITITVTVEYHDSSGWHNVPGANNPDYVRTSSQPCYSASCSITSVTGDGPSGVVLAGGTMHVSGTFTNNDPAPDYITLINPVLKYAGNNNDYPPGGIVDQALAGGTYGFSFDIPEGNSVPSVDNLSFTPVYHNDAAIGGPCVFNNVWSYQQFGASGQPYSHLLPSKENPSYDNYWSYIDVSEPTNFGVNLNVSSSLLKNNAPTGVTAGGGQYGSGRSYILGGGQAGANYAPITPNGVDQFCTTLSISPTSGYVGPDHNPLNGGSGSYSDHNCDNETNEPYFKVYGSGAAADLGAVEKPNASGTLTCTPETSSGLLAGWNDNVDDGADRGAGSQLSSLALLKITGFASAQTNILRKSPIPGADLSFANSGNDASGTQITPTTASENPSLGGSYGSQPNCVKPPQPETSVAQTPSPGSLDLNGGDTSGQGYSKSYKGNLTLTNSAVRGLSGNSSVFVDGNVYINSNLQLNQTGWSVQANGKTTVPSFTLTATGNIYIAPGVTKLDGLYVSSGTIYTCSTAYAAMPASQLYDSCHNQLVFTGNVMADQVKMMRTFGSLRDEKANPQVDATQPVPGVPQIGLIWTSGGTAGVPAGYSCVHIDEPADSHTWDDNYLCEAPGYNVGLAWTHDAGNPSPGGHTPYDGWDTQADIQAKGYPYCTAWNVPDPDTWYDNVLCASKNIGLTFSATNLSSSTENCVNISESSDPDANWNHGGYWLCAQYTPGTPGTVAVPPTANLTPSCSHAGTQILRYTCAAEVIQFSPELYLGNQTIDKDSNGAVQYDSITSLPPVL